MLRNRELTLILMASSADPTIFKELLRGKKYLEKVSVGNDVKGFRIDENKPLVLSTFCVIDFDRS